MNKHQSIGPGKGWLENKNAAEIVDQREWGLMTDEGKADRDKYFFLTRYKMVGDWEGGCDRGTEGDSEKKKNVECI